MQIQISWSTLFAKAGYIQVQQDKGEKDRLSSATIMLCALQVKYPKYSDAKLDIVHINPGGMSKKYLFSIKYM